MPTVTKQYMRAKHFHHTAERTGGWTKKMLHAQWISTQHSRIAKKAKLYVGFDGTWSSLDSKQSEIACLI